MSRNRFLPLLQNELAKAVRRKFFCFGFFAVALLCAVVYVIAGQLLTAQTANAWGYCALSMMLVFNDIGLIFILVFSGMLIAEETATGTIRSVLAAPVFRWELYLAKAVTGLLYMLVLFFFTLGVSAALARVHYNFGAAADAYGVVYSRGTILLNFLFACVLSWLPLGTLVMFGLLVSTLIRSSGAAVAAAITTIYLVDFTKNLVGMDRYIFTRHISYPWQVLGQVAQGVDYLWQPEVWNVVALSGACGVLFFSAGLLVFVRRDYNH